jgi:xylulokinase
MGVMLSAAGALQWYRETLAPGTEYRDLLAEAETVAPGCDGLVFLPYLTGERCPHADPTARAAFVGLTVRHSRGHLTRAVLEGVAFGLLDNLNLIRAEGIEPGAIRASGGGVMSGLWLRILADVLRTRIVTVNAVEGAAIGAAILAAVGVGFYRTAEEACLEVVRETSVTEPGEASGDYDAYYSSYRSLYPILAPTFASLSALS